MPAFTDFLDQAAFLESYYLQPGGFVADGGAKIKFFIGGTGSGKSCWLEEIAGRASALGYLVARLDARELTLRAIDDLYRALLSQLDVWEVVRRLTRGVMLRLGADPSLLPPEMTYVQWCASQGRPPDVVRREVRAELEMSLYRNVHLERSFALAIIQMAASELGALALTPQDRLILESWLRGQRVLARERQRLNLRRAIDKTTARIMLRSWLHVVRMAGCRGQLAAIDNLDVLLRTRRDAGEVHYTRTRRDDLYEMLRELIDEMDALEGFLLIIAAGRELFEDARSGVRSYPALWMRLQNEVHARPRLGEANRFADVIDLDQLLAAADPRQALRRLLQASLAELSLTPEEDELRRAVDVVVDSRDSTISAVGRAMRWAADWAGRLKQLP